MHFLDADRITDDGHTWYAGFAHVWTAFAGLAEPARFVDSFLALFLLGVLLCQVRARMGLWWCIGLHAAWVFSIRVYKELTVRDIVNPYQSWVGDYDNFVGHLVSVWVLFLFVLMSLYRSHRKELAGSTQIR